MTDLYGRHYRIGLSAEEISGHSRRVQLWAAWVCMVVVSPLQYSFGIAVPGLQASNGWGHTQTLWLLAVFVACQAGVAVPVSWLHRSARLSAGRLVVVGGLLSAVGLLSLVYGDAFAVTLIGYSLVGGAGAGMLYSTCLTTIARWFPDNRVAMSGFVTGGFACGAVPTIALVAWLDERGTELVFALAGLVAMVVVPAIGRLLTDPPRHWWPAHIDAQAWAVDRRLNSSLPRNIPAARHYSPADALRTGVLPRIWLVLASISA
ncbi:MAG: MFS transporter [Propionibacteriales bacterium]|nr:MFS transporter [Propionibacteriales bacterium]